MKTSLILAIVYLLGAPFLGALLEGLDRGVQMLGNAVMAPYQ